MKFLKPLYKALHTNDASETVNRVIDFFPADHQQQIRLNKLVHGILDAFVAAAGQNDRGGGPAACSWRGRGPGASASWSAPAPRSRGA